MRRATSLLAAVCLLLALTSASALARHGKPLSPVQRVLNDCSNHNHLTHHYPPKVLEQALAHIPTDDKEYSICADEIQNALNSEVSPTHKATDLTPTQQQQIAKNASQALKRAASAGAAPIDLSGQKIAAGAVTLHGGSLLSDVPTPLLIVLILLLALGLVPVALRAERLVRARRSR